MHMHLHLRKRHIALAATTVCLAGYPRPAFANNGLRAMGEAFEFIAKIIAGMTFGSIVVSLLNLATQSVWLRILSVVLLIPATLLAVVMMASWPMGGIPAVLIVAGLHWLAFTKARSGRD